MPNFGVDRSTFDALVIGAGACGSFAAKALTEGGLTVALFEAGSFTSAEDLQRIAGDRAYFYKEPSPDITARRHIQARCYACRGSLADWFVNDLQEPYVQSMPFDWIRMRGIGGRLLAWEGQSYRFSNYDFLAADLDGQGQSWPIRYEDLESYYAFLEVYLGVTGTCEGAAVIPDGIFGEPYGKNVSLDLLAGPLRRNLNRLITPARLATMTCRNHYKEAERSGLEVFGTAPPFYTPVRPLYDAAATGLLTIFGDSVVSHIVKDHGVTAGVTYIDKILGSTHEVKGKVVVLCASTLESTRLLLASNIGASLSALGSGLMDHWVGAGASGVFDVPSKALFDGGFQRHRIYIPRFRNLEPTSRKPFLRGYGFQGKSMVEGGKDGRSSFGKTVPIRLVLTAFGETLASADNSVKLADLQDEWGVRVLNITMKRSDNDLLMARDAVEQATDILITSGARDVRAVESTSLPGLSIHEVGTARMGLSAANSVVGPFCEVHDTPNIFVTDGACWPSSGCANPTLTMMAITLRTCRHILSNWLTFSARSR